MMYVETEEYVCALHQHYSPVCCASTRPHRWFECGIFSADKTD